MTWKFSLTVRAGSSAEIPMPMMKRSSDALLPGLPSLRLIVGGISLGSLGKGASEVCL